MAATGADHRQTVAPRVSGCPHARRKCVRTSSSHSGISAGLTGTWNGEGQDSALKEHNLVQNLIQRYVAPRGLATHLTLSRRERARQKGSSSLLFTWKR